MIDSFWKDKKVLVTGHTGFKGAWLCLWLNMLGAKIAGYSLDPPTVPSLYDICSLRSHVYSVIGDIRNREFLESIVKKFRPQIIFHLAAQSIVRESYNKPVYTYETNVMGTVNLLESIRGCDAVRAVINVTTDKCYENRESFWGYREDDRLGGFDPYSSSKACSELITESYKNSFFHPDDYSKHGVAIATVRAGNVIGGGDFATDRLVPDCIKGLIQNEKILVRNPRAVRPWQHVLEPLCGYIELAEKIYREGVKFSGAWNFGPNEENEKDVEYIVEKICSLWGCEGLYVLDKGCNPHETNYLKLDSSKAKRLLGFKPRWDLDIALEKVVNWAKEFIGSETSMFKMCCSQIEDYMNDN